MSTLKSKKEKIKDALEKMPRETSNEFEEYGYIYITSEELNVAKYNTDLSHKIESNLIKGKDTLKEDNFYNIMAIYSTLSRIKNSGVDFKVYIGEEKNDKVLNSIDSLLEKINRFMLNQDEALELTKQEQKIAAFTVQFMKLPINKECTSQINVLGYSSKTFVSYAMPDMLNNLLDNTNIFVTENILAREYGLYGSDKQNYSIRELDSKAAKRMELYDKGIEIRKEITMSILRRNGVVLGKYLLEAFEIDNNKLFSEEQIIKKMIEGKEWTKQSLEEHLFNRIDELETKTQKIDLRMVNYKKLYKSKESDKSLPLMRLSRKAMDRVLRRKNFTEGMLKNVRDY